MSIFCFLQILALDISPVFQMHPFCHNYFVMLKVSQEIYFTKKFALPFRLAPCKKNFWLALMLLRYFTLPVPRLFVNRTLSKCKRRSNVVSSLRRFASTVYGGFAPGTWIFRYSPVRYLYLFATLPVRYLPFGYLTCSLPSVFATCIFRYPDFVKPTLGKH